MAQLRQPVPSEIQFGVPSPSWALKGGSSGPFTSRTAHKVGGCLRRQDQYSGHSLVAGADRGKGAGSVDQKPK